MSQVLKRITINKLLCYTTVIIAYLKENTLQIRNMHENKEPFKLNSLVKKKKYENLSRIKKVIGFEKLENTVMEAAIFSSPEQRSGRTIVLPSASALALAASASASTNVKVFVKVFKTSLFPNPITDLIHLWYNDTYWSKFLRSTNPHHPRSRQGQGHRLRILMFKFYSKYF